MQRVTISQFTIVTIICYRERGPSQLLDNVLSPPLQESSTTIGFGSSLAAEGGVSDSEVGLVASTHILFLLRMEWVNQL